MDINNICSCMFLCMLQNTFHNQLQKNLKFLRLHYLQFFLYFRKYMKEQNDVVRKLNVSSAGHPRDRVSVFGTKQLFYCINEETRLVSKPTQSPIQWLQKFPSVRETCRIVLKSTAVLHPESRFITSGTELNWIEPNWTELHLHFRTCLHGAQKDTAFLIVLKISVFYTSPNNFHRNLLFIPKRLVHFLMYPMPNKSPTSHAIQ